MRLLTTICTAAFVLFSAAPSHSQSSADSLAHPKYEFRASWIATVARLDWPKTSTTAAQQDELISMLDELKEAGINAVFFQIRTESDALYQSDIEPWSYWLTGEQGTAPDPFYDPLQFAIEEAHKRGMELHAWFNPYRADRGSAYTKSPDHITNTHPEWILEFGSLKVLNPGIPEVQDYVLSVVEDVVTRYDVDGLHFDDYFYPYPPNHIANEDQATFEEYGGDFTDIGEWRRANVDSVVAGIHEMLEEVKPHVEWGLSPFGIWKNGVPSGIVGLDAYNVIYADAVEWLDQQWIDYLTPQLYWAFGGGQDYGKLAPWWAEQTARNERHLYPGHGLYRSESATFSGSLFSAGEVPRQIRFNRNHEDIQGSVFFRAENITRFSSKGFADSLKTNYYRYPALTPIMPWRSMEAPAPAEDLAFEFTGAEEVTLSWIDPEPAEEGQRFYVIYRVRAEAAPDPAEAMADARNIVAVTGETSITDRPGIADDPYHYFVTAANHNSVESEPTNIVTLEGRATAIEQPDLPTAAAELLPNYPNPFREATEIAFRLDRPGTVTLRVYNMLGQIVSTLIPSSYRNPGVHAVQWNGSDEGGARVAPGTYFYSLEMEGSRLASRAMVLVR